MRLNSSLFFYWWIIFFLSIQVAFLKSQDANVSYIIGSVHYDFQRTKVSAFDRYFGNIEGRIFSSQKELDEFLEDLRQRMLRSSMFRILNISVAPVSIQGNVSTVSVTIKTQDSWPGIGLVFPFYTTSTGFTLGGGGIFPNIGGYLFDIVTNVVYNAEPRNGALAWGDPTYQGGIAFSKIPLGNNLFFGVAVDVVRKVQTTYDRGVLVFIHRSIQMDNKIGLLWHANNQWSFLNTAQYIGGFMPQIEMSYPFKKEFGSPKKNYYIQKSIVTYDGTERGQNGMPIGLWAQTWIGYSFNEPYDEPVDHAFYASSSLEYTWNIHDIFFPRLSALTFYKTGIPEYNLASQMRGIIDGEWKGNGITRLSMDFLFYIYELPGWLFLHMGPYVDYGISYGTHQKFLETDQGWTIGLRIRFMTPLSPSTPLFLDLGYDLRDKYKWTDRRRFEVTIGSTFNI